MTVQPKFMSQSQQDKFEVTFQNAVRASLNKTCVSSGLRERISVSLSAASNDSRCPESLDVTALDDFQTNLSQAVAQSQVWAPSDEVALRVESYLSAELKTDLLSERSVHCASQTAALDVDVCPDKTRFLKGLRDAVYASQSAILCPTACRRRIEEAIASQKEAKILPFPTKSQWKRGIGALASVAAGFAVLMGSLFGSADKALANSVRRDHQMCCRKVNELAATSGLPESLKTLITQTQDGTVPKVPLGKQWGLVISKICVTEDGHSMVHDLYRRGDETLSLHFFPPDSGERVDSKVPKNLSDGAIPVMAWEKQGWTITACSSELDEERIKAVIDGH